MFCKNLFKPCLIWVVLLLIIITFIRTSVVNVSVIASGSMLPNFEVDSRIISNQLSWGFHFPFKSRAIFTWSKPRRGDIVLFKNPYDDDHIWMKRVIGMAGDTIIFRNHQLYVNHKLCTLPKHREHLPNETQDFSATYKIWSSYLEKDWGPIKVPDGKVFLMGDNRGDSIDSRKWGSISTDYLTGHPIFRISSFEDMGWLPNHF